MRGNVASFGLATALLAGCWWFDTSTPDAPSVALSASASVRLSATPSASAAPSASGFASAAPSAAASASTSGSSASSPPASSAPATWTYGGATGPSFWGDIHADFARCKSGARQSPVDLPSSADRVAMPGATKAEAGKKASKPEGNTKKAATAAGSSAKARPAANDPRALSVDYLPFPALVRNDGWAIEITNRSNNYVTVGGKRFELLTAQFHSPSEHTIAGKRFDLELQLRHKAGDGAEVAIAVLFERGATPEPLAELWKRLPTTPNAEPEAPPAKAKPFDAGALVSLADGYFVYEGSHTTPPCAEGVTWFVLKRPATIAPRDVERYRELFGGRTNRMVMPLGGRAVTELVP